MSKRTHEKQLARARAKRRAERRMIRRRRIRTVAIILVVTLVGSLLAVGLFRGEDEPATPEIDDAAGEQTVPDETAPDGTEAAAGPCAGVDTPAPPEPRLEPYDGPPEMTIDPDSELTATIATTCGDITIELFAADAPTTVNNFVFLARDDYYRGVPFHRVRPGFVIQAGDPTGTGSGCVDEACETRLPGYTFEDELGRAQELVDAEDGYPRGTVAMANAGPDTNGSQFFIVQGELAPLPPDFTVFGRVTSGMDVVDDITAGESGDQVANPEYILDITGTAGAAEAASESATADDAQSPADDPTTSVTTPDEGTS